MKNLDVLLFWILCNEDFKHILMLHYLANLQCHRSMMSVRDSKQILAREAILIEIASSRSPDEEGTAGRCISWANIVQDRSQSRALDLYLMFVPPTIINGEKSAFCQIVEKEDNLKYWKFIMVGYVLGKMPYFVHLKQATEMQ